MATKDIKIEIPQEAQVKDSNDKYSSGSGTPTELQKVLRNMRLQVNSYANEVGVPEDPISPRGRRMERRNRGGKPSDQPLVEQTDIFDQIQKASP